MRKDRYTGAMTFASTNEHRATRHAVRAVAKRTAAMVNALLATPPPDAAAIVALLCEYGELEPVHVTTEDVQQMHAGALALWEAFAADPAEAAADRLNSLLAGTAGPLRLTGHAGTTPWHLHLDSDDEAPWGEWFRASSSFALAVLFGEYQRLPGGVCASPSCDNVYVALGAARTRRFCSRRCATRERVANHRRDWDGRPGRATDIR